MTIKEQREKVWQEYVEREKQNPQRLQEIKEQQMTFGEATMKYGIKVIGEPDENGYPLFIALHGGGYGDTPDVNNQQWEHMSVFYAEAVKQGVYVNPRGVRDTWDTHANPESYPLYDRLIQNMILFYNVDPNRVYIMGYSAGGDGVYLIAPRMADRFAACNMSAGHPNGISLVNLYNEPICLQGGMLDDAYDRHKVTAEYILYLDKLAKENPGAYPHTGFVHKDKGHHFYDHAEEEQEVLSNLQGFIDNDDVTSHKADANAIHFMTKYTRTPLPEKVVWDLSLRAPLRQTTNFYWLDAPTEVNEGLIVASLDKAENAIRVEKMEGIAGQVSALLNDDMLDLDKPVKAIYPDGKTTIVDVELDEKLLIESTRRSGDKNVQFVAKVDL